jgi:hypothetical protein
MNKLISKQIKNDFNQISKIYGSKKDSNHK